MIGGPLKFRRWVNGMFRQWGWLRDPELEETTPIRVQRSGPYGVVVTIQVPKAWLREEPPEEQP